VNLKTSTFLEFQSKDHLHCICEFMKQNLGNTISHHGYDLLKSTYVSEPQKFYLETFSPTLLAISKDLTRKKPKKCEHRFLK
jgi:hypothetical protein